jgi:hypothetical protein
MSDIVPEAPADIERELTVLESELRRLEAEYNMFFAGRSARPPSETRSRVDGMVKRLDRQHVSNYGARFRFTTLQSRYAAFVELWDRSMRSREEGRRGPAARPQEAAVTSEPPPQDRVLHVTSLSDPASESEKIRELYESVSEARRQAGHPHVPYRDFATLVEGQVARLKEHGGREVTFRLSLKEGKVSFTARAIRQRDA